MKNALLIVSGIFILLLAVVIIRAVSGKPPAKKELTIRGNVFKVDIADTEFARMRGLSWRQSMGEDEGMLFIFPIPAKYTFWMKGMKFPLDFIWISNGSVAGVTTNVPIPTSTLDFSVYSPPSPVDQVLEVNVGTVERLGIRAGDAAQLK